MSETNAKVGVTIGTKAETAPVDRYAASVTRLETAIKGVFASGGAAASFGAAFSAGALSVQSMIGKISEAISGSSELASEMALVERRAGLAGEAFQVLSRSGKVASEELVSSLGKYRVKLGEALAGNLEARKIFSDMRQSPEALTKLPMERQLELVGAALGRFGDRNREADEAQKIFGKGYSAMLPLLEKLRTEGYDKLKQKVSETAGVLENDMARALGKAKREASEAGNQLTIALAPTNLRLLKMKAAIADALSDHAGSIQSAGTAIAGGFLTAATLSQIVTRIGPQLNVVGSQAAGAFSKGFGVGAALLPGIIAERMGGPGGAASFAGLGKALATPFGAAMALVIGGFLVNELERVAMEAIGRIDAKSSADFDRYRGIQGSVKNAASDADLLKAQAEAAKFLSDKQAELDDLNRLKTALATMKLAPGQTRPQASAADERRLATLRTEVELAQGLVKYAIAEGAARVAANTAARTAADLAAVEAHELEKTRGQRESLMEREKQNRYAAIADDAGRLQFLKQWRAEEEAAGRAKIAATQNAELRSDHELQLRVRLAEVDAKIAQVREQAADEAERAAKAAEAEVDRLLEKVSHDARNDTMRGLDGALHGVAVERARTQGDFRKSAAEKWVAEQDAVAASTRAATAALQELEAQKRIDAAMGANTDTHDSQIQRVKDELDQLEIARLSAGPDPTSWVDQTAAALNQLRDNWGTTAQQIAGTISGTIGTAVDSVAENITHALLVTGDWAAAFANVGMTIATQLVQAIVAMGARWVATHIMMAVAGKVLAASSVAAMAPIAAAQAAVWATPATLATIASFGGAAAAAPAEIAGAIGMTQLLSAVPGFSDGGYTGESGGVVHPKEFVFSAPAVDAIGLDNLEALHHAGLNPSTPAGGMGGSAAAQAKETRWLLIDHRDDDLIAAAINDPRFENKVRHIGRKNPEGF